LTSCGSTQIFQLEMSVDRYEVRNCAATVAGTAPSWGTW
jgi:hypothetical protein